MRCRIRGNLIWKDDETYIGVGEADAIAEANGFDFAEHFVRAMESCGDFELDDKTYKIVPEVNRVIQWLCTTLKDIPIGDRYARLIIKNGGSTHSGQNSAHMTPAEMLELYHYNGMFAGILESYPPQQRPMIQAETASHVQAIVTRLVQEPPKIDIYTEFDLKSIKGIFG